MEALTLEAPDIVCRRVLRQRKVATFGLGRPVRSHGEVAPRARAAEQTSAAWPGLDGPVTANVISGGTVAVAA